MNPGRRLRTAWPALCLLACAGWAQAEVALHPVDGSLTPAQAEATRELLADAVQRLPTAWADALDQTIEVEWRDDLPAQVHGRAQARRLLLDRALLDGWMARPRDAGIEDPATRAALAAVIHELAHFYDRTPQGQLSRDPRLLDLAGWQVSPMRLGVAQFAQRLPRPQPGPLRAGEPGRVRRRESRVLPAGSGLRLPPAGPVRPFRCAFREPPAAGRLRARLRGPAGRADASESPLLQLDPDRVYAVEYLLAEGNERPMSRWGHSMLRLVVCAPGRARGPDCRLDLQYHLVLSFRAFVGDVQISSWRGLTGSYPSRLFVLPLAQVIEEYTRVELRGLQSIPLQLDPAEIADLLERTARLHWSYDGHYYFLSNNCAVETFKLLHDGVPRLADEDLSSITPTGLLRRLKHAGIADSTVLDDRDEAMRLGYYFEALSARYQAMFEVARQALQLPQAKAQDWLDLPADERAPWLPRADLRTSAALLLLEQAALRRQELLARDELKRRFLGRNADRDSDRAEALVAVQDVLRLEGFLSRPAALLPDTGYGLPQSEERETLTQETNRQAAQWRQQSEWLRSEARRWMPPERLAALDATEANVDALGEQLRRLHEEQGGLQLR